MIKIEAVLEEDGTLRACRASGHAKHSKILKFFPIFRVKRIEADTVCAAVSVLIWTAIITLSGRKGIEIRCDAPAPGQMWLEADYQAEGKEFLFAAGVFLLEGLKFVAREYPKNCELKIEIVN